MHQILEIFGIDWRLLLVQIFNFGLLVAILWYFLYKPVVIHITARQQKIAKGVEDAAEVELAKAAIEEERGAILVAATKEADRVIETAKEHAEAEGRTVVTGAQERAARLLKDAEARAQETHDRVLAESQAEVAKLAVLAAEKVLRERA